MRDCGACERQNTAGEISIQNRVGRVNDTVGAGCGIAPFHSYIKSLRGTVDKIPRLAPLLYLNRVIFPV